MGGMSPADFWVCARRAAARAGISRVSFLALVIAATLVARTEAHNVAQVEATKYLAPETVQLLIDNATVDLGGR